MRNNIQFLNPFTFILCLPFFFVVVSCHLRKSDNIVSSPNLPPKIETEISDREKKSGNKVIAVTLSETGKVRLEELVNGKEMPYAIDFLTIYDDEVKKEGPHDFALVSYDSKFSGLPKNEKDIVSQVDEMAFPYGGLTLFNESIAGGIKYPDQARAKGVQGKVYVSFVVETNGTVSNIKVDRSIDPLLDAEAVRVVSSVGGRWRPAYTKTEIVRQKMLLPIVFKLNQ